PKLTSVTCSPRRTSPVTNSLVYVQTPPMVSAVTNMCIAPIPRLGVVFVPECHCSRAQRTEKCNGDARVPRPYRRARTRRSGYKAGCQETETWVPVHSPRRLGLSALPASGESGCDRHVQSKSSWPGPREFFRGHRPAIL